MKLPPGATLIEPNVPPGRHIEAIPMCDWFEQNAPGKSGKGLFVEVPDGYTLDSKGCGKTDSFVPDNVPAKQPR